MIKADQVRAAAFDIFEKIGNPITRVNRGQQWIVQSANGEKAILKTAAKGGLMVKSETPDNDAKIVGFDADVSHIIAAVADGSTVTAYLVPIEVAEAAYRHSNEEWLQENPEHNPTTTWVLRFPPGRRPRPGHNMAEKWAEYAVGSTAVELLPDEPKDVLERCRAEIAKAFSVDPRQVRISVDL